MIDYDKLVDRLSWHKEAPHRYKGRWQAYTAEVSDTGLVVYRWNIVVHYINNSNSMHVYRRVADIVNKRAEKQQREFTAAFHDYFGED